VPKIIGCAGLERKIGILTIQEGEKRRVIEP
jgi:hypothetical protein